jgi:hypothetical protein
MAIKRCKSYGLHEPPYIILGINYKINLRLGGVIFLFGMYLSGSTISSETGKVSANRIMALVD